MPTLRSSTLLFLPLVASLFSCHSVWGPTLVGSGVKAEDSRAVPGFSQVRLAVPAEVVVRIGPASSIEISADDNIIQHIETSVTGDRLLIDWEGNVRTRTPVVIHLTTPELESFAISGSGEVEIHDLHGPRFEVWVSGSGEVVATGNVERIEAGISGSGDLDLSGVKARKAEVSISGSGDIRIHATETLDYSISGSGDIRVSGGASSSGSVSGSGGVTVERSGKGSTDV